MKTLCKDYNWLREGLPAMAKDQDKFDFLEAITSPYVSQNDVYLDHIYQKILYRFVYVKKLLRISSFYQCWGYFGFLN
jgi:hypothetical protein